LFPVFFYTSHNFRLFLCRIGAGEVWSGFRGYEKAVFSRWQVFCE
jgi:hypothetical protein